MIRKLLFSIWIMVMILSACNLNPKGIETGNAINLIVSTFDQQAPGIIGQNIKIEGIVLHTCKHSGKRMFIVDGNDSMRVEVTAGKDIPSFEEMLIGKRLRILGILKEKKIDQNYLNEWENEINNPEGTKNTNIHRSVKGQFDQSNQDKLDQINSLRNDLKNSKKNYLSFFYIEASKFEEIKK